MIVLFRDPKGETLYSIESVGKAELVARSIAEKRGLSSITMKAFGILLLLSLALSGADAFTTAKKREKRPGFQSIAVYNENRQAKEEHVGPSSFPTTPNGPTAMFAFPPSTTSAAIPVVSHEDAEDEVDVSYGVAMISCVLSLALGFGFGYGT